MSLVNVTLGILVCVLLASCAQEEGSQCTLKRRGATIVEVRGDCSTHNFDGVDLRNADTSRVQWGSATCPDGSNAQDHGGTCQGHLDPDRVFVPDMGPEVTRDVSPGPDMDPVVEADQAPEDMPEAPRDVAPEDLPGDASTPDMAEEILEPDMSQEDMPLPACSSFYFDDRTMVEGFGEGLLGGVSTWTLDAWILPDQGDSAGGAVFSYAQREAQPPTELSLRAQPDLDNGAIEIVLWIEGAFYQAYVNVGNYGEGWLHVSLEMPSLTLYLNGLQVIVEDAQVVQSRWDAGPFADAEIFLGGTRNAGAALDRYQGYLSEVHLQRGEVHQGNFLPSRSAVVAQSTLGLWRFDEGAGSVIYDSGPGFHTGTVLGQPLWYPCLEE